MALLFSRNVNFILLCLIAILPVFGQKEPVRGHPAVGDGLKASLGDADFDIRDAVQAVPEPLETLQALESAPGVRAHFTRRPNGRPKSISAAGTALSAPPRTGNKEQMVRDFLRAEAATFAFLPKSRDRLRMLSMDESPGLSVLHFQQHINGIPVFEGSLKASLNRQDELIRLDAGSLLSNLSIDARPKLTGPQAIEAAYRWNDAAPPGAIAARPVQRASRAFYRVNNGPEVATELVVFPMRPNAGRLAYRIFLELDAQRYYEMLVDAADGSLLLRHNLVRHAAQGRVWKESPLKGPRELVTFPDSWLAAASVVTTGNNADVFLDTNGDGRPDTTNVADIQSGRALSNSQVFDFPAPDVLQDPRTFKAASVTNLFYLANAAHDFYYALGFTEAAGNFQTSNFGRGGTENDAVIVHAQSGAEFNNASFVPLPDGIAGVMRVGIFTNSTFTLTDDRDAGYDGTIVLHEYGHGVSTRLVGGPSSTGCLAGMQSRAMGEGWSDYFAASYYNTTILGGYATQEPKGLRRQDYATYTLTYEDIGNEGYQVHQDGEIWAATLLDARRRLGSSVMDRLVMNGLKLTPCSPSMIDGRDAILAADQAANNGANRVGLWQVFARHGMGASAKGTDGKYSGGTLLRSGFYLAAFDLPTGLETGNIPPKVTSGVPPVGAAGTPFTFKIDATDSDGGTLKYELVSAPPGFTISTTGLMQGVPEFTSQRVKIVVTDGQGGRAVVGFLLAVETPLAVGSTLNIQGARRSAGIATIDVPANTLVLQATLRGGTGDADLYAIDPDGRSIAYGARTGLSETLSISAPKAGRWAVPVYGYQAYSGKLLATEFPVPKVLTNSVPVAVAGVESSESYWRIAVPPGTTQLLVQTSGGTGDVDLFVKRAQVPTCQTDLFDYFAYCIYDSRSVKNGNAETVTIMNPAGGDWYINVSAALDSGGVTLTATLTLPPPGLSLNVTELTFASTLGAAAPAPQNLIVAHMDPANPPFGWTAATTTASGGAWIRLGAASGDRGTTVPVSMITTGLVAGIYRGTITVTAPGIPNSPRVVTVTLNVTPAIPLPGPRFSDSELLNGASFTAGISPGSWFMIRGTALAQTSRIWAGTDFRGTLLPTSLDGVSVKVNGKDALVYYISDTQINALAPDDTATGPVPVTVTTRLGTSSTTARLAKFAPAFFMFDPGNRRYAAAIHPDGSLAGPDGLYGAAAVTRPLAVGDRFLLYGTGFGPTEPASAAASILTGAPPLPAASNLILTIGGVRAALDFAGMTSNGLYQFNVVVPQLADGDHALIAEVGGVKSPAGVFLNLRSPPPLPDLEVREVRSAARGRHH